MIFLINWLALSIVFAIIVVTAMAIGLIIYYSQRNSNERILGTQHKLSDRDLLLMIGKEPDGMITAQRLTEKTKLSKKEATARLYNFYTNGILKTHYSGSLRYYYSLKESPEDIELIDTSGKPFLTVEDILLLFKHYDFRLTIQQIIMSTGLPLSVIKKELKYFIKEKVVELVYTTDSPGMSVSSQTYLLAEPYRSNHGEMMDKEESINLELEKIYLKQMNDLV